MSLWTIPLFLNSVLLGPLQILVILRICMWFFAALTLVFIAGVFVLNNSLTAKEARRLLKEYKMQSGAAAIPSMAPKKKLEVVSLPKVKKQLITFTLSDDAKALLGKISLQIDFGNGWTGTPENASQNIKLPHIE